jgi:hypothetical protein
MSPCLLWALRLPAALRRKENGAPVIVKYLVHDTLWVFQALLSAAGAGFLEIRDKRRCKRCVCV